VKHKTDYPEMDYKTEKQWNQLFKIPKEGAHPTRLWSNPHHNIACDYYSPAQMRDMTETEKEQYQEAYRAERRKLSKLRRERIKKAAAEEERRAKDREKELAEHKEFVEQVTVGRQKMASLIRTEALLPDIPCNNPSGVIVFDVETTGLDSNKDEILQISILDGNGNVLLSEYVKPYYHTKWEAVSVHGITMDMLEHAPYPHELVRKVKGIFASADTLVSYNGSFDLGFLSHWGIRTEGKRHIDVMEEFAPVYGEWDDYHQCYKWKSLSVCADFFGYQFRAHDSLEDTKATLWCFNHLNELIQREKSYGTIESTE